MDNLDYKKDANPRHKYGVSKAGNFLHGSEYAKRHSKDGILSVVSLPFCFDSLQRYQGTPTHCL